MAEKVGRISHDCLVDELPEFHDHSFEYSTGDYVRCSCGVLWFVKDARFCHYRKVTPREERRLIRSGVLAAIDGGEQ